MKAECGSARWNEGCLPPPALLQPFVPLQQHRKAIGVSHLQRVMRHGHHHLGTQTVETPVGKISPRPVCLMPQTLNAPFTRVWKILKNNNLQMTVFQFSRQDNSFLSKNKTKTKTKAKRKETRWEKRGLLDVEACRGTDIDVNLIVILGNSCFPTYSTIIRTEGIINLKKHLPQERRQIFPDQADPYPAAHPLGPLGPAGRAQGSTANTQGLGSPSHGNCGD